MIDEVSPAVPSLVCAFDLGGTNLRAATIDENGKIHFRVRHDTPSTAKTPDEILRALVVTARECETRSRSNEKAILAASVVVPGTVDSSNEVVIQVPNLRCLDNFPLKAALEAELGWPIVLENDANAAAIGEMWMGAGRCCRTIVCMTLGTGVGGGIILDGKLWRGADGSAGEIGHTTVDPNSGVKCKCGNTGCLEVFASATAIVRMTREALPRYPQSILREDALSAAKVYEAGLNGDELALEVLARMGTYLGIGIANVINLLNPEMIAIGGGVANGWQLFEKQMHREVAERAFPLPARRVRIVPAECGDDAGLLGAARLAFDKGPGRD